MSPARTDSNLRVCTIILNWNQPAMTSDCVRAVLTQTISPENAIVVIDNGSKPDNLAMLEDLLPVGCMVIKNKRNLGFAGGMNIGIQYSLAQGFHYVWLLNNDAFPEPECLAALLDVMDADTNLSVVSPLLLNSDQTQQELGGCIDFETAQLTMVHSEFPKPAKLGWYLTGAAILVRADVLRTVGAFDERFFAYWEDADLFTRIASKGGNFGVVENAKCIHLGTVTAGVNSPVATHLFSRNGWLFLRKHHPVRWWPRLWLRQAALQLVYAGSLKARGRDEQAAAVLTALWAGLTNQFHKPGHVFTETIFSKFIFNHFWGIARLMWSTANLISPASQRRPPLQSNSDIPNESSAAV